MILDTIVARKKEEVSLLKVRGIHLPPSFTHKPIDPPRGFRQALIDYPGVANCVGNPFANHKGCVGNSADILFLCT